jgi:hypothetical protein
MVIQPHICAPFLQILGKKQCAGVCVCVPEGSVKLQGQHIIIHRDKVQRELTLVQQQQQQQGKPAQHSTQGDMVVT